MSSKEQENCEIYARALAAELGFKKFVLEYKKGAKTGFLGEVFRFKIVDDDNGKQEPVAIVIKHVPLKEYHETFSIYEYYHVESLMYTDIFDIYDKLQNEAGITRKFKHIKVFKTILERSKEAIVMADLGELGFRESAIGTTLDMDHSKLILEEIGKCHALSYAMRKCHPVIYDNLNKNLEERMFNTKRIPILNKIMRDSIRHAAEVIANNADKVKLLELEKDAPNTVCDILAKEKDGPNTVITHGDLWANNVLYRYNGDKIEEVILIDWQTIRCCSPVMDVLFFMLTSIDPNTRSVNFKELLDTYYTSLSSFLRLLNCDPDLIFSYDAYCKDLKKYAKVAITHALMMLPIFSNGPEDFSEDTDFANEDVKALFGSPKQSNTYVTQVRGLVNDMIKYNLF